jgi:hypothetical protein
MDGDPVRINDYAARIYATQMIDEMYRHPERAWQYAKPEEVDDALRPVFYNDERLAWFSSGGIQTRFDLAHRLAELSEDKELLARLDDIPPGRRHSRR